VIRPGGRVRATPEYGVISLSDCEERLHSVWCADTRAPVAQGVVTGLGAARGKPSTIVLSAFHDRAFRLPGAPHGRLPWSSPRSGAGRMRRGRRPARGPEGGLVVAVSEELLSGSEHEPVEALGHATRKTRRNRWQPLASVFAWLAGFSGGGLGGDCHRLRPRGSIKDRLGGRVSSALMAAHIARSCTPPRRSSGRAAARHRQCADAHEHGATGRGEGLVLVRLRPHRSGHRRPPAADAGACLRTLLS
jgi:hypothetical protein